MVISKQTQYFKLLVISVVAVIFIIASTRQKISATIKDEHAARQDSRSHFIKQVEENLERSRTEVAEINYELEPENNLPEPEDETSEPFNERMPGAYLRYYEPAELNQSYCKFNYKLPYDLEYYKNISKVTPEQGNKSPYRVLYNVTEAYSVENAVPVTYATHMSSNFANFIPELLRHWDGLVVVAAFVPDLDAASFLEQVNQFCYCEPEMYRVSIHLVTLKNVPFSKKDIYFDRPNNCVPQESSHIQVYTNFDDTVTYPVNVLRNVARTSALTKYVLLCDIELMPSKNLASGFLSMIDKYQPSNSKEVFVLPIFEVESNETVPENKRDLLQLYEENKAVYFHQLVCAHCQKFPGIEAWLTNGFSEEIEPLVTVKRHAPYHRWEPIFIGTNMEPLYNEQLSWEGLQDKMTQSLEMCLQNYNYTILDNAFLCHWPGIKKHKTSMEGWREVYVKENEKYYMETVQRFLKEYVDVPECKTKTIVSIFGSKKKNV